jgi:ABC-type transport system involved in Fe-S cluster assembly fused permease/ATPase subunit
MHRLRENKRYQPVRKVSIDIIYNNSLSRFISLIPILRLRFYEAQAGRITIDGIDIRSIPATTYRKYVSLVSQEPTLFEGTSLNPFALLPTF